MASAFVLLINRRGYDESAPSPSSSPPSLASSKKKNYSEHTNEYIILLIKKWKSLNLQNTNLWGTFRDDFEGWTEQSFKTATNDVLRSLRNFLRKHGVWIPRQERKTIAKSLQEVLEKDTETAWTEEKILDSLDEKFESSKITRLIETDFERNPRDYSWQASSRSESRRTSSRQSSRFASSRQSSRSRESSFRDRSLKERSQKERSLQQSSMRYLPRESSIARNFLRQSSSSQSEIQEIPSSEIPQILQNLYIRQSSSSENSYIRQSEKESMLRQSFQSRFPKFYQSSELSEQFYRRSTGYSPFVPPRSPVPPRPPVPPSPPVPPRPLPHEYSSPVSPQPFASSPPQAVQPIKPPSIGYGRELANLAKLYSEKAKYSGKNDNFSFKLTMFNDMCDRVDVSFEAKLKAFSTMLKELALDYYYANVISSKNAFTFDDVCISIMSYFEDAEYKRSILNKWNNITLRTMMSFNENKSMNECLQLLIKELRHLQHDLESTLRIDDFIHNKLVNACQKIPACQYACFKSSEILTELINDLKSSIIIYQKAHFIEFSFFIESTTHFIDRRYHRNFSSRISQNREYQDRGQHRGYQNRRNQDQERIEKKCFVCQKEECWSTKHSRDEREDAQRKFKNRFIDQMNKRIDQYIAEYEELEDENDQNTNDELIKEMKALMIEFSSFSSFEKNENAETFIIIFGSMKNFELMTTDLVNRSFSHYLIDFHTDMNDQFLNDQNLVYLQISLKKESSILHTDIKDTNLDSFAYVMIFDRYISEKFYEVMIDSDASTKSTAEYEQYLAFNKMNLTIDLNSFRTETVNIQFDIESASSIKSLIIDISFEIMKFHVIKTDISFLLSLADMNRLKIYFNNVKNILIMIAQLEKSFLSVIRRFDHEFLLWKNFMQTYIDQSFDFNFCYLIETKLRQLHKRFDHSSTRKLHDLLERFDHDVKKSVLKKLSKFCIFCQKHEKSSERFKFTLRDDVNFNYSVIVDVMYVENSLILHVIDEATRFQAAKWLQNISAKHIWEMLRLCWIDVYLSSSDHILHDADKNFVSRKFRQFVT